MNPLEEWFRNRVLSILNRKEDESKEVARWMESVEWPSVDTSPMAHAEDRAELREATRGIR